MIAVDSQSQGARLRVLFAVCPGVGQVLPMLPLASAMRSAGHDVLVASCGEGLMAAGVGLPVADIGGTSTTMTTLQQQLVRDRPDVVDLLRAMPYQDVRRLAIGFAHVSSYLTDALVEVTRIWRPDLIVYSQFNSAALVAAAVAEVPAVEHGFGPVRTQGLDALIHEQLASVFERYRVTGPPQRHTSIDVAPPSLRPESADDLSMRYVPFNGGVAPSQLLEPSTRPRIAITVGTVVPREHGLGVLRHVINVAADVDAEFVVAMREPDIAGLGTLPANVWYAGWMPMTLLLRTCAGLIHHGGAGSSMAALEAAVPQLVLADGADRHLNAESLRRRGLALVAEPAELDPALITRLIQDKALHIAAAQVGAEMAQMPSPTEIVPQVVALTDRLPLVRESLT